MVAMDAFPNDLVAGLGVIAKGHKGTPEDFYVFVNANDPTAADVEQIEAVMGRFGALTSPSYDDLAAPPPPHFVASGEVETILIAMNATYPGRIRQGPLT